MTRQDNEPYERNGCRIEVIRRSRPRGLSDARIRRVVRHVLHRHDMRSWYLEIVILGSAGMERLNRQWLGHEGVTDVIAFDLSDEPVGKASRRVAGQINVCWPVACRQAARRGHAAAVELLLYIVHGLLHLLGYDDHSRRDAARMHSREDELLSELGYGNVYASVADLG